VRSRFLPLGLGRTDLLVLGTARAHALSLLAVRLVAVFYACAHYMRWTWAQGRTVPDFPGIVWCLVRPLLALSCRTRAEPDGSLLLLPLAARRTPTSSSGTAARSSRLECAASCSRSGSSSASSCVPARSPSAFSVVHARLTLSSIQSTVFLVYRASRIAHGAAGALVKLALASVEDLVLDLDEAAVERKDKVD